jgi:hypothetical protein
MIPQVPYHLVLDLGLEEGEHQAEARTHADLAVADHNGAAHARPLKMNVIAFPAVVDVEFAGQIAGQFVGRGLSFLSGQVVVGMEIDERHKAAECAQSDVSLDGRPFVHQYLPATHAA